MHENEMDKKLIESCFNGKLDVARSLLVSGADVNTRMEDGWNPLHAAIENMHSDVVKLLIENGADLESKWAGFSALHHAIDNEIDIATQSHISNDSPEPVITKILLDAGAKVNEKSYDGMTPLEMARERGHEKAVVLLKSRIPT